MRGRLASLVVCFAAWASVATAQAPTYIVALGDSLSLGIQPSFNGLVPTNQGYADDLFALFRSRIPDLQLVKLGCSGESTATMIHGGECESYPDEANSQLTRAVDFLRTHKVAFVTLDIGADDIISCATLAGINQACVTEGLNSLVSNLPVILAALRWATGGNVPIIAMNYYDPGLALYVSRPDGPSLARASLQFTHLFNRTLAQIYSHAAVPVADVAAAFHIDDRGIVPFVGLPLNVLVTLAWTWMGAPPPIGPDIHPNAVGYAVIASAFLRQLIAP
jgi:lysophospholipase L1-like esterase